ncbi:MAG: hypothetical protein QXF26_04380 [Candidatus Bathyarchaeia archaeon]
MEKNIDIYSLLLRAKKRPPRERAEILRSIGITQLFYDEGDLRIDMSKCVGVECKLCIKACPTSALYWDEAKVKLERDLCIYCSACVLNCIVDNCIILHRRGSDGRTVRFGTPREAAAVNNAIATWKRVRAVSELAFALSKSPLR